MNTNLLTNILLALIVVLLCVIAFKPAAQQSFPTTAQTQSTKPDFSNVEALDCEGSCIEFFDKTNGDVWLYGTIDKDNYFGLKDAFANTIGIKLGRITELGKPMSK